MFGFHFVEVIDRAIIGVGSGIRGAYGSCCNICSRPLLSLCLCGNIYFNLDMELVGYWWVEVKGEELN